jgi:predicted pyridoxine 5'-phosphate oxidase superfamily flavin-nucleotide-binding protein
VDEPFSTQSRRFQDKFDTRRLADRIAEHFIRPTLSPEQAAFIASARMVFLATVTGDGQPECTYKGGRAGFITVVDEQTLQVPFYNGNGIFSTLGNIIATGRIGLFFIDFEDSYRLRVNGTATVADPPGKGAPGALQIVTVRTEVIYDQCERYVHRMKFIEESQYCPDEDYEPPTAPYLEKALYDGARPGEK